jgi:hypothetical protein
VHGLAADIYAVGWDWSKVQGGICVQEDPSDSYIETYNHDLVQDSQMLASIEPKSILAGTLTNGHTVLMLRAILAGVRSTDDSLSIDGKLSIAAVHQNRPEMAKAAMEGWTWCMIHHECRKMYGEPLFELLSSTKNVNVARKEHEIEVLVKIASMVNDYTNKGLAVQWDSVNKRVSLTKPECTDYIPTLMKYVRECGGGHFVNELSAFHRRHVPGRRFLGGQFWESIANLLFKEKEMNQVHEAPLLRMALLKAEYLCPEDKVFSGQCKFTKKSELDALTRKSIRDAVNAEELLAKARGIVLGLKEKVNEDLRTKLFALLDVQVVRVLMNKQQHSASKYASVEAVGDMFMKELRSALGDGSIPSPWPAIPNVQGSDQSTALPDVKKFTVTGELLQHDVSPHLMQLGFVVGSVVACKSNKAKQCTIQYVSEHGASIVVVGGDGEHTIPYDRFIKDWSQYHEEVLTFDHTTHAASNEQFDVFATKGTISSCLGMLSSAMPRPELKVVIKPVKAVSAMKVMKSKSLVLLPETMSIVVATAPPAAGQPVEIESTSAKYYLMPPQMSSKQLSIVVPFWLVRTTNDESLANMQMTSVSAAIAGKIMLHKASKTVNNSMKFPAMVNTLDLKVGDELVVFVPPPAEQPPSKKRRSE